MWWLCFFLCIWFRLYFLVQNSISFFLPQYSELMIWTPLHSAWLDSQRYILLRTWRDRAHGGVKHMRSLVPIVGHSRAIWCRNRSTFVPKIAILILSDCPKNQDFDLDNRHITSSKAGSVSQCENLGWDKCANRTHPFLDKSLPNLGPFQESLRIYKLLSDCRSCYAAEMFCPSSKYVPRKRFCPQPVGVNAQGILDRIFQIAVVSEYVSKFGWGPFSDLRD